MIIKNVTINNFYCFLDLNVFEFSKGLNIVSALNSGGKSQLFNAFYWTFFNKIYVDKDLQSNRKEWKTADSIIVLPEKLIYESNNDERIESFVEIVLSNEFHDNEEPNGDLVDYIFRKSVTYQNFDGTMAIVSRPELIISYVRNGETNYIKHTDYDWFLESIFPSSIRKFMWFQGETVDDLYDFSRPSTLNNAIHEISYFPLYDNINNIVNLSVKSIERKIDKELSKRKKFTKEQEDVLAQLKLMEEEVEAGKSKVLKSEIQIQEIVESIAEEEYKLKGFDKYAELKANLNKIEYELQTTKDKIEHLMGDNREKLISKWMLNGCENLVKASTKNINILNEEIKNFQKTSNPVPITLPGPEYVQRMLDDHMCYICERDVEDDTDAYRALQLRLQDFKHNMNHKILIDNYTDLNRFRKSVLNDLPDIEKEIVNQNKEINKLIEQRNKLQRKKENIFSDSGVDKESDITIGSTTASQILAKINSLRSSKERLIKNISTYTYENERIEEELKILLDKKANLILSEDENLVESEAKQYIELFAKVITTLRNTALDQLIEEIQKESNELYSLYLGGKTQGEIKIDKGVAIVDRSTNKILADLNTAEIVAQKLAVANAFLSLSEKKMRRSFPLVADAPTSDLDYLNTANLTKNIGKSFAQMIIMSKDYALLKDEERDKLIDDAKIVKYYELNNDLIDQNGLNSRINKKTFINIIK